MITNLRKSRISVFISIILMSVLFLVYQNQVAVGNNSLIVTVQNLTLTSSRNQNISLGKIDQFSFQPIPIYVWNTLESIESNAAAVNLQLSIRGLAKEESKEVNYTNPNFDWESYISTASLWANSVGSTSSTVTSATMRLLNINYPRKSLNFSVKGQQVFEKPLFLDTGYPGMQSLELIFTSSQGARFQFTIDYEVVPVKNFIVVKYEKSIQGEIFKEYRLPYYNQGLNIGQFIQNENKTVKLTLINPVQSLYTNNLAAQIGAGSNSVSLTGGPNRIGGFRKVDVQVAPNTSELGSKNVNLNLSQGSINSIPFSLPLTWEVIK
jgi:hypothetical protein